MADERTGIDWTFWVLWVVASILGFMVSLVVITIALVAANFIQFRLFQWFVAVLVMTVGGAIAGVPIGIAQGLALGWQRQALRRPWWVVASAVGLAAGLAVGGISRAGMSAGSTAMESFFITIGAVMGVVGGTLQGLFLFAQHRQILRVVGWVLASVVGWTLSMFAVPVVFGAVLNPTFTVLAGRTLEKSGVSELPFLLIAAIVAFSAAGAVGGLMYGAITGTALVWPLRHRTPPRR